jgi:hypothetical protein
MNAHVTPLVQPDLDLDALRAALSGQEALPLVLTYAGRTIQPGYHVTEIKAARFSAIDCGGNPDSWTETVLQVEDIAGKGDTSFMSVGKFLSILGRVDSALAMDATSRVTIEVSRPGEAMQVFDIAEVAVSDDRLTLVLEPRPAICKPRHRTAAPAQAACCAPSAAAACCA